MSVKSRPLFPDWLRRFARLWGFAVFVILLLLVFRAIILPFVLGLLLAYILAPFVARLEKVRALDRPMPRWMAIVLVYVVLFTGIGSFGALVLPPLSAEMVRLLREGPGFFNRIKQEHIPRFESWLDQQMGGESGEPNDVRTSKLTVRSDSTGGTEIDLDGLDLQIEPEGHGRYGVHSRSETKAGRLGELFGRFALSTQSEMKDLLSVGQRVIKRVVKFIAWFVLTLMVAAYILIDPSRVMGFLRSLFPKLYEDDFRRLMVEMDRGLSGVIRGQLFICITNGILTTIGLLLFHVRYSFLLGLIAGVMSFIPVFGSILSSVPIVLVAILSGPEGLSLSKGAGMLLWIVAIHLLEANVLNPKIIGSATKIHPVVVAFALLAGEQVGGLVGAVLAVPIASLVQATVGHLRSYQVAEEEL